MTLVLQKQKIVISPPCILAQPLAGEHQFISHGVQSSLGAAYCTYVAPVIKSKIGVMEICKLMGATKKTSDSIATETGCARMSSSQL
jgi:hypothetical protein